MNLLLKFSTIAALIVAFSGGVNATPSPIEKPNFVFLFYDNLGYGDVEPYGSTINHTPHLTRMAEEGRLFTDFYVSAGVCTPSRASFLTGCYPRRVNMHQSEPIDPNFWAKPRSTPKLPSSVLWPGKIPAGSVCKEVATTMDLLPTYAQLAGGSALEDRVIDGRDVRSLVLGEPDAKSPHEALFYYYMDQLQAVRSGDWKLYLPLENKRRSPFSFIGKAPGSLFNLRADLSETKDLFDQYPEIVDRLTGYAEKAREDLGDLNHEGSGQRPAGCHPDPTPRLLGEAK